MKEIFSTLASKFELSRGGGEHNLRSMEGLRGFAVFLVFVVHYVTLVTPWLKANAGLTDFAEMLHTIGNVGVDLFFVLSGYLIYGTLIARPHRFLRFMARRIQRIYPTFIVVFLIYAALSFIMPAESKLPHKAFDAAVYLIENFLLLPGIFPIDPMITVAWSLSYEMFYYLVMPLLVASLGLRMRSSTWRVAFFLSVFALASAYCAYYGGLIRLIMFVSGILLHEAMQSQRSYAPGNFAGLTALILGLLCMLLPLTGNGAVVLKVDILFATFFVLCLACFRAPSDWLAGMFSWTPLRWLGNMSYSYYLIHGLALKAGFMVLAFVLAKQATHGWAWFFLMLPFMFALSIVPSAMLFLFVERPFSLARPRVSSQAKNAAKVEVASETTIP